VLGAQKKGVISKKRRWEKGEASNLSGAGTRRGREVCGTKLLVPAKRHSTAYSCLTLGMWRRISSMLSPLWGGGKRGRVTVFQEKERGKTGRAWPLTLRYRERGGARYLIRQQGVNGTARPKDFFGERESKLEAWQKSKGRRGNHRLNIQRTDFCKKTNKQTRPRARG